MADTHPNAYAAEVAEKRKAASNLNAEADLLQSQWEDLTGEKWPKPEAEPEAHEPKGKNK